MTTATAIRVTAEQLKKFGWRNVYDHMVQDLNQTIEKYQINTPARLRHFLSQCAHESGLGQWTKELADGRLYEHRRQLGNVKPGDGPKYKGAGYLQLTGRSNYQKFADEMGDPRIMDGVEHVSKNYPWTSAGHFWKANNINALIDRGANVKAVTKVINGGLRGLEQREEYFRKFAGLVDSSPTQGGTVTTTARGGARLIQPRTSSQGKSYTVKQGDSLWKIAQDVHVDVNAIKKANPDIHNPNNLQVGKVINIPSAAGGPGNTNPYMKQHKVKQGNTLYLIARQYEVSEDDIKKANPGIDPKNLPVGSTVNIPIDAREAGNRPPGNAPAGTIVYRVHHTPIRQGEIIYDTIDKIARKFEITSAAIKAANPNINIHVTPKEGTLINIPIAKMKIQAPHFDIIGIHEKVWNFFINKGFSATATAGIMGNLQQESDMNPKRYQDDGGPGRGIGQWEDKRVGGSGRWNQLVRFAGSENNAWKLEVQLEYMLKDLKKGRGGTGWVGANYLDEFGGFESLKKMGIYQAVVAFECSFELAGKPKFPWRFAYADTIYRRFARGVGRAGA